MEKKLKSPVLSYDSWSPLEEVWLGDVYPESWYDHLDPQVKDVFHQLTEITKHDLGIIQKKLEDFGVKVCRPVYDKMENYLDRLPGNDDYTLRKPEITPRDYHLALGNYLFAKKRWGTCWDHVIDEYESQGIEVKNILHSPIYHLSGAHVVRVGKDVYIDFYIFNNRNKTLNELIDIFYRTHGQFFEGYRVHFLQNGGHIDACFTILKPGLILANHYFSDYDITFPGWQRIEILKPEFYNHKQRKGPSHNSKFYLPGIHSNRAFTKHVVEHALDWIGDYTETYFEVNCLVIDEKNVMILGENESVFREIEKNGMTVHSVPFRTRSFWDGGLHCLTLDVRRRSEKIDFFPERGDKNIVIESKK